MIADMQNHIAQLNRRIEEQQQYINELKDTTKEIINHNLQLVKEIETYYDVRRRSIRLMKSV